MRTGALVPLALLGAAPAARADDAIEDNSFFVEEAYNQEPGVIQHIQVLEVDLRSRDWTYAFTEEWPARDQEHQVSVTVPIHGIEGDAGLGDVLLNYRRELFRNDALVVTPRLTLALPSGNPDRGFAGDPGLQVQACVSVRPHDVLALHSNLGLTTPLSGDGTSSVLVAQSLIWLAHPRLNLLAEAVAVVPAPGHDRDLDAEVILSPGLRTALDFSSGLQIVPGVAAPVTLEERAWGVLVYLSFEHPLPVARPGKDK